VRFEAFGLKKGGEERIRPLQKCTKNSHFYQEKKESFCAFIHSFIRGRFGGTQMDAAADDDDDDEREKEGSAKEKKLEKSTLRVVQRELESVPSSTKAANGKVKSTLTTPLQKASLFCLVVSSFCIRAPPRETGTRETHFAARSSALRLFFSFRRCINEEATSFISPRKKNC